ncbi:MAG: HAMP domain-containing sensor histidine kinase, partial [Myxococcota bacterium]|nr:HAMP domain-containing sensor histidine kinase [Myxococcota bacterium]
LLTGGLLSPIVWWCLPVPLLAGNTSGIRASKVWAWTILAVLFGIWWVCPEGLESSLVVEQRVSELLVITTLLAVLFMVLSSYLSFEKAQTVLLGQLREVNAALHAAHLRAEQKVVNLAEQQLVTDRALADTRASLRSLADSSSVKSDLLRMVSHDLRSPLSEIMGLTALMYDEIPDGHIQLSRYASLMEKSSQRMRDLLEGLLNLARVENGVMAPSWQTLDAADLVQSVVTDFETRAHGKGIRLEAEVSASSIEVVTDITMFMQIMQNLISNAVKYSPRDSVVRISARANDDYLWVAVCDEGPGISESDQERMYQPFARLTARPTAGESSTGLGLSIVKSLVGSVEGVLECKSALGQGTEFELRLPRQPIEVREMLAS